VTALEPAVYEVLVDELRREDAARSMSAEDAEAAAAADDVDPFADE